MALQAIAIPPKTDPPPRYLLIALHGWGANAYDLASLAPLLELPEYQMLFPNAPFPHPYAPAGRMWYNLPDTYTFQSLPDFQNQPNLLESRRLLLDALTSLSDQTGIPLSRTVLAGFSQGGAMTLDVGVQLPLAALVIMSGYLHAPLQPAPDALAPILMVHGRQDPIVPITAALQAKDSLEQLGATVEYHELEMGHEISPKALEIMQSFMRQTGRSLDES